MATSSKRLSRDACAIDAKSLAQELIGATLVRPVSPTLTLRGRIVETEAYIGVQDRASHAFGARRSKRNEMMYAKAGTAYVYFTYGMHHCINIVCGEINEPVAVLLRALEPLDGLNFMHKRRTREAVEDLCSGPGKLCQAFAIDREHNGIDLVTSDSLWIEPRTGPRPRLVTTPRIGISSAGVWAKRLLRWYDSASVHVSSSGNNPYSARVSRK